VYGVAWYGDTDSYQGFVSKHHLTFPTLMDQTGDLFAHFKVPGQPAWVFVDAGGKATVHIGAMEKAELTATLDELAT
jgi:peroxiredoxin